MGDILFDYPILAPVERVFEAITSPGGLDSWWALTGPEKNAHFRVSGFCWAMYLRLLRRYVEIGQTVEYSLRLDV